jgi:hypothetical protein
MPTPMRYITRDMVRTILNAEAPASFDSHWLEKRVLRHYTIPFANELIAFGPTQDPLHRFSMAFSQWFGNKFKAHITKASPGKIRSENLAGDVIANQGWTKRHPGTPIP